MSRGKIEGHQVFLEWFTGHWSQRLLYWPARGKLKCSLRVATAVPLHLILFIIYRNLFGTFNYLCLEWSRKMVKWFTSDWSKVITGVSLLLYWLA